MKKHLPSILLCTFDQFLFCQKGRLRMHISTCNAAEADMRLNLPEVFFPLFNWGTQHTHFKLLHNKQQNQKISHTVSGLFFNDSNTFMDSHLESSLSVIQVQTENNFAWTFQLPKPWWIIGGVASVIKGEARTKLEVWTNSHAQGKKILGQLKSTLEKTMFYPFWHWILLPSEA